MSADDTEAQDAAVTVIEEAFYPRESACLGCGVADSPQAVRELSDLVRDALRDGVSVAAYLGDAMVGVAVNKIQVRSNSLVGSGRPRRPVPLAPADMTRIALAIS